MKINFKKIEAQTSFEGAKQTFDVAETVGNEMMYNGSILLDIGFEDWHGKSTTRKMRWKSRNSIARLLNLW